MAATDTVDAFIALGSNLYRPADQVASAIAALGDIPQSRVVAASRRYRNPPMGPTDQPDYINAVARVCTRLDPHALLDALQGIEQAHGRMRTGPRWSARILDLDLLLYGDRVIADDRLEVPHPGLPTRSFVLYPLAELEPDLNIPGFGSIATLLAGVSDEELVPID